MILKEKANHIIVMISILTITLFGAVSMANDSSFETAKQEIMLRKIGHELLLKAGDSLSRVLPIRTISKNEYSITFENEFTFQTDSLVAIIKRSLATHHLNDDYIVNVMKCAEKEVIYGYAILGNKKDDIIACSGRIQPKSCYYITIKFQEKGISTTQKGYLLGGLPLLAFVGFWISKSVNGRKKRQSIGGITLGKTLFNEKDKTIVINNKIIDLTLKENKLFSIFAQSPNMVIERTRLQKEIWEDEGVIVGRSLDVFISRLRKKLEADGSLQIVNIHNKGYKLEVLLIV